MFVISKIGHLPFAYEADMELANRMLSENGEVKHKKPHDRNLKTSFGKDYVTANFHEGISERFSMEEI